MYVPTYIHICIYTCIYTHIYSFMLNLIKMQLVFTMLLSYICQPKYTPQIPHVN